MVLEAGDLNFIVEVTDVADDRHIFHVTHMFDADHISVACCGDENIRAGDNIFKKHNFKAIHGRLQGTDGVNFRDLHTRTGAAQGGRRAFAHIAIT